MNKIPLIFQMNGSFSDLAMQAMYVFLSLTVLAAFFEGREKAKKLEIIRNVFYIVATQTLRVFTFESRFSQTRGSLE